MELKDFIEKSVSDIVDAIFTLQKKYNTQKNWEPEGFDDFDPNPIAPFNRGSINLENHKIDFDIAVTTSEKGNATAGGKIGISVLGAKIDGEKGYNNENSSRIKFSIPFYPETIKKN